MKQDWHPDELTQHWTLAPDERQLLGNKTGATRLSFAILLKAFQFDGRFPDRREDIAGSVIANLASQIAVQLQTHSDGEWSERTQRQQRAQIRAHCGFRLFRARDEPALITWLSERVNSANPEAEALKIAAYGYLRSQRVEPPTTDRLRRLLSSAVAHREERLVAETTGQLSPSTRAALDGLVRTRAPDYGVDTDQMQLFPVRSEWLP